MHSKVAVVRCPDYDPTEVRQAVSEAIGLVGGIEQFTRAGRATLVKPNLLSAREPDRAVTTHPVVVETIVDICKQAGSRVLLGDSPPFAGETSLGYARLLDATGMSEVAKNTGAEIVRFEEAVVSVPQPGGCFYKSFELAKAIAQADTWISVPKLKTHNLTYLSGAVKNSFGCVPGKRKAVFHAQAGDNSETFSQMLVDLLGAARPNLCVTDAVVAMDGDGPASGRVRSVGLIMASADPVALDAVASAVLGIGPLSVDTTRLAAEQGLGTADLALIEVLGERIDDVRIDDFLEPKSKDLWGRIPRPLRGMLKAQIIPFPRITERCKSCGACMEACPVGAIHGSSEQIKVDLDKCIRCYCCREVCEHEAIDLRIGRLSAGLRTVRDARRAVLGIKRKW